MRPCVCGRPLLESNLAIIVNQAYDAGSPVRHDVVEGHACRDAYIFMPLECSDGPTIKVYFDTSVDCLHELLELHVFFAAERLGLNPDVPECLNGAAFEKCAPLNKGQRHWDGCITTARRLAEEAQEDAELQQRKEQALARMASQL